MFYVRLIFTAYFPDICRKAVTEYRKRAASTGLISTKNGQNDEYMTKATNCADRPPLTGSSADYAGSKRLRQAAGKASAPRVAIQAQPG